MINNEIVGEVSIILRIHAPVRRVLIRLFWIGILFFGNEDICFCWAEEMREALNAT